MKKKAYTIQSEQIRNLKKRYGLSSKDVGKYKYFQNITLGLKETDTEIN